MRYEHIKIDLVHATNMRLINKDFVHMRINKLKKHYIRFLKHRECHYA